MLVKAFLIYYKSRMIPALFLWCPQELFLRNPLLVKEELNVKFAVTL